MYEPFVVVEEGEVRETSRAAEPWVESDFGEHYHRDCHASRVAQDEGA
jgi:hypothetical protein